MACALLCPKLNDQIIVETISTRSCSVQKFSIDWQVTKIELIFCVGFGGPSASGTLGCRPFSPLGNTGLALHPVCLDVFFITITIMFCHTTTHPHSSKGAGAIYRQGQISCTIYLHYLISIVVILCFFHHIVFVRGEVSYRGKTVPGKAACCWHLLYIKHINNCNFRLLCQ